MGYQRSRLRLRLEELEPRIAPTVSWNEIGLGSATLGGISNTANVSQSPSIAMGADGYPIVAWSELSAVTGNYEIFVRRWDGSSWTELGGSASGGGISNNLGTSDSPSIALGSDGHPIVAWRDLSDSTGYPQIYARRWNGASWESLGPGSASGGGISNTLGTSGSPSLAVSPNGVAVVAWMEYSPSLGDWEIYVRHWSGSSWAEYLWGTQGSASGGGISDNTGLSYWPAVTIGTNGYPIVAWTDTSSGNYEIYVKHWDGASWSEYLWGTQGSASGAGISNTPGISLLPSAATGADGNPMVVWQEDVNSNGSPDAIYALRWNGSSWMEVGTGSASGGGISGTAGYPYSPRIAFAPGGSPAVVVWGQDTDKNQIPDAIYALQWGGSSWSQYVWGNPTQGSASGNGIWNTPGESRVPSVAFSTAGHPFVAWQDNSSGNYEIYAVRWGLSEVTIVATDAVASEPGTNTGAFTFRRTGDTSNPLVVRYSVSGTATTGDYVALPGTFGIPAGSSAGTLILTPLDDSEVEGTETVILSLVSDPSYVVGSPNSATVTILDNDSRTPTGVILLPASDTGISNSDRLTNLDNSASNKKLQFEVSGTVAGATVTVYWGTASVAIGSATASGATTVVLTNGQFDLPDGEQLIVARQTEPGAEESGNSPALTITIDTVPPPPPKTPVLHPASDTGFSNSDGVTQIHTPTLNLDGFGSYYRLYRNGELISNPYASAPQFTEAVSLGYGVYTYTLKAVDAAGNTSDESGEQAVAIAEEIPLVPKAPRSFTDGDTTLVTATFSGIGGGYITLTNGLTSGAPIHQIYLSNTSDKSSLTLTCKDPVGAVSPGTTFNVLLIQDISASGTGALGMFSARDVNLAPNGKVEIYGDVKAMTLRGIGDEANLMIAGSLGAFTATVFGAEASLQVEGNLPAFKVNSVDNAATISATGDIRNVIVAAGDMNGIISAMGPGGIGSVSIPKGAMNGDLISFGGIKSLLVGGGALQGILTAFGPEGIGTVSIPKGGFTGTITAADGAIKNVLIGGTSGTVEGLIEAGGTGGIGAVSVPKMGLNGATISATHTAGAGIGSLTVNGGVTSGGIISEGTGGVGKVKVIGDLDANIQVPRGHIGSLTVLGMPSSPKRLYGVWEVFGLKTLKATFADLVNCRISASSIGAFQAGGLSGTSSIQVGSIGKNLTIQGDLASDAENAIYVTGSLGAKAKIDISGTGTYGTGLGKNRIKIGAAAGDILAGQILIGTGKTMLQGMFGDVVVTDSLHSVGTLKADEPNPNATIFASHPNNLHYVSAISSGQAFGILFGAAAP